MNLKDFLYKNKITHKDFAASIGISYSMLMKMMNGTKKPSYEVLMKIYRFTNKKVSIEDIVASRDRRRTRVNKPKCDQNHDKNKKKKHSNIKG